LVIGHGQAQSFDNIEAAIKTGDVPALSKHFEGNVEIHIKDAQNSYSKSQAEAVLKNFFDTHTHHRSFAVQHRGRVSGRC
jgi:hypothetical protein